MAAPLGSGKQTVDLAAPGVRGSRIRRDPPPKQALRMSIAERDERHRRMMMIGVATFAAALFVIILALGSVGTWSPSEHTVHLKL